MTEKRIVVAGAGMVGCFVGGLLAAAGHRVTLLGRERVLMEIAEHGLTTDDFTGFFSRVSPGQLDLKVDPAVLGQAELILVTVRSGATARMAAEIAARAAPKAQVVSLQNGIDATVILQDALPDRDVRAGMVPFNVVPMGKGRFHRASSGDIVIGPGPGDLARVLSVPGLKVTESAEIFEFQAGKLVLNLPNALNALPGLTLRGMLLDRSWRRLIADQSAEALAVYRAAGLTAQLPISLPIRLLPPVLRLPTVVFRTIAARMLTIDPLARTSTAYDLVAGRPTEVEAFQGAILRLAGARGISAPLNARVMDLIRAAEAKGAHQPGLTPEAVRG